MSLNPYTYLVLRYVHDRGAGEALNVGVLLFCHQARFLSAELEYRYERLSSTFAQFDGEDYRRAMARVRTAVLRLQRHLTDRPLIDPPESMGHVMDELWTDSDTSFQWSEPMGGVAADPATELSILFDRMVTSQYPQRTEIARRDDDFIWRTVYQQQMGRGLVRAMTPKRFITPHLEVEFDHALKNGAWHVVQPLSLDYKQVETIQRKASEWLGTTVGLTHARDLAGIYFLLGRPTQETKRHRKAYDRAKALLDQAPVKHRLVEEDEAPAFAKELEALLEDPHQE